MFVVVLEFPEETWDQRLFLFQETIVERFGFVRCTVESSNVSSPISSTNSSSTLAHQHQYVHLTGNMFILIPSQPCQVCCQFYIFCFIRDQAEACVLYHSVLTFKHKTFKMVIRLVGQSLFKCPLLLGV